MIHCGYKSAINHPISGMAAETHRPQEIPEDDPMGEENLPEDEEEGEDLFGNDMMDDYRADPALDQYASRWCLWVVAGINQVQTWGQ